MDAAIPWITQPIETLVRFHAALPWQAGLAVALLPTLTALFSRNPFAIFATALLNIAGIVALARAPLTDPVLVAAVGAFLGAMILAAYGFHSRRRDAQFKAVMDEIDDVRRRMQVFCDAMDERGRLVDEQAGEAWKKLESLERRQRAPAPKTQAPAGPPGQPSRAEPPRML